MAFNPNDYVTPYVTLEEVLEIKKAFDLFDRDLGGAIDPRGKATSIQSSKLLSTLSVSKPRLRPSIKWLLNLIKTAVDKLSSPNSSTWWPLAPLTTRPEMKFTKFSSPSTHKRLVFSKITQDLLLSRISEKSPRISVNSLMTLFSRKWSREPILTKMVLFPRRNSMPSSPRKPIDTNTLGNLLIPSKHIFFQRSSFNPFFFFLSFLFSTERIWLFSCSIKNGRSIR